LKPAPATSATTASTVSGEGAVPNVVQSYRVTQTARRSTIVVIAAPLPNTSGRWAVWVRVGERARAGLWAGAATPTPGIAAGSGRTAAP
jgi:hypothetical protein